MEECDRKPNVNHRIGKSHINRNLKDEWQLADGNLGGAEDINMLDAEEIAFAEILRQKKIKVI